MTVNEKLKEYAFRYESGEGAVLGSVMAASAAIASVRIARQHPGSLGADGEITCPCGGALPLGGTFGEHVRHSERQA